MAYLILVKIEARTAALAALIEHVLKKADKQVCRYPAEGKHCAWESIN